MNSTDFFWRNTEYSNPHFIAGTLKELESTSCLEEQVTVRRDEAGLKLFIEMTNQVLSNSELCEILQAAMRNVRTAVPSDVASVFLQDADSGELRAHACDFPGNTETFQEEAPIALQCTIAGSVLQSGKTWAGAPEEAAVRFASTHPLLLTDGFKSGCMLPIPGRHRILGTLCLGRYSDNRYRQDELDFLMQVAKQIAVAVESDLAHEEIRQLKEKLAEEKVYLEEDGAEVNFAEIVGKSSAIQRVLKQVKTVAPTDSTVLICGETGTGKELIAQAIHNLSRRQSNAFVKLNCAAIPTGLLESELFGHEKGAFTSAVAQRLGRFEVANKGTIFLDEIGEIPLELQTKLLRVLQEREFERLGSSRTIRSDARLIAATNRDLAEMVEQQKFRSDLFYRLNVFPVQVPGLRERPEDIPLLVRHFVQQFARRMNRTIETIPCETMNALVGYAWPGNIRELQNLMERAVILSSGPVLHVPLGDLPARVVVGPAKPKPQTHEEAERAHILSVLKQTNWVMAGPKGAAALLGMNRSTVYFRMRKLGIVRHVEMKHAG